MKLDAEGKHFLSKLLEEADDVQLLRSVHEEPPQPGDEFVRNHVGSLYVVFRVGPEEVQIENAMRSVLNHDPMGFKK